MAIDIAKANTSNALKNGTMVVTCGRTGFPASGTIVYDKYVLNTPTISNIENKYDNRFYNGLFVNITGSGIIGV